MSLIQNYPEYQGGSIVNLMSTILAAYGKESAVYTPLTVMNPDLLGESQNIVLLMIDGLGYRFLQRYGDGSTLQRHLLTQLTSVFPTTTATAVTSYLTGVAPQQHAITGWHTYLRELGTVTAILPFRPRWGSEPYPGDIVKPASIIDQQPIFDRIGADCYIITQQRIIDSAYSLATCGKARRVPYTDLAGFIAAINQTVRASSGRKYIYAYWPDLDGLAHIHGIHSQVTLEHFTRLDLALTSLISELAGSKTTLIITGDHGLIDTSPDKTVLLDHHPDLAETLALPLCGEPRLAYCYVRSGRADRFIDYVSSRLAHCFDLHESESLLQKNFFGLSETHPRLRERIGDYVLLAKDNYVIKDYVLGEPAFSQIGVHGGLSEDELLVPLIVAQA